MVLYSRVCESDRCTILSCSLLFAILYLRLKKLAIQYSKTLFSLGIYFGFEGITYDCFSTYKCIIYPVLLLFHLCNLIAFPTLMSWSVLHLLWFLPWISPIFVPDMVLVRARDKWTKVKNKVYFRIYDAPSRKGSWASEWLELKAGRIKTAFSWRFYILVFPWDHSCFFDVIHSHFKLVVSISNCT